MNSSDWFALIFTVIIILLVVCASYDIIYTQTNDNNGTITSITNNGGYYSYTVQVPEGQLYNVVSTNLYNLTDTQCIRYKISGLTHLPFGTANFVNCGA